MLALRNDGQVVDHRWRIMVSMINNDQNLARGHQLPPNGQLSIVSVKVSLTLLFWLRDLRIGYLEDQQQKYPLLKRLHHMLDPLGEISPVHRWISSA